MRLISCKWVEPGAPGARVTTPVPWQCIPLHTLPIPSPGKPHIIAGHPSISCISQSGEPVGAKTLCGAAEGVGVAGLLLQSSIILN